MCVSEIFCACQCERSQVRLRQKKLQHLHFSVDRHIVDEFKNTHLYVICLCCHFCPVRAYRRFLTLNLAAPPIWSGTPHLGLFIHLWRRIEGTTNQYPECTDHFACTTTTCSNLHLDVKEILTLTKCWQEIDEVLQKNTT